jgi:hypothetical protein
VLVQPDEGGVHLYICPDAGYDVVLQVIVAAFEPPVVLADQVAPVLVE